MDMKPFNLEEARQGKPVCTRDGGRARIICFDRKNNTYPIIALVNKDGLEVVYTYTTKGEYSIHSIADFDLMMAPTKRTGWINLLQMGNHPTITDGNIYSTEEEAQNKDYHDNVKCVKTIKIEWEE